MSAFLAALFPSCREMAGGYRTVHAELSEAVKPVCRMVEHWRLTALSSFDRQVARASWIAIECLLQKTALKQNLRVHKLNQKAKDCYKVSKERLVLIAMTRNAFLLRLSCEQEAAKLHLEHGDSKNLSATSLRDQRHLMISHLWTAPASSSPHLNISDRS